MIGSRWGLLCDVFGGKKFPGRALRVVEDQPDSFMRVVEGKEERKQGGRRARRVGDLSSKSVEGPAAARTRPLLRQWRATWFDKGGERRQNHARAREAQARM